MPECVERARFDERFEHAAIHLFQIHARTKIVERFKRFISAPVENRLNRTFADIFYAEQAKANRVCCAFGIERFNRKFQIAVTHIGRQNLNALMPRVGDKHRNFFRVANVGAQQRGHVFNRVMRF